MKIHDLKVHPQHFGPLLTGEKRFELRLNDRGYQVGDVLRLRKWSHEAGFIDNAEVSREVYHLIGDDVPGIALGFVCMSVGPLRGPALVDSAAVVS